MKQANDELEQVPADPVIARHAAGDLVTVSNGYYAGAKGRVVRCNDPKGLPRQYEIELSSGLLLWIQERNIVYRGFGRRAGGWK